MTIKPLAPETLTKNPKVRHIAILAFPGVEVLDVTGPFEVFAFASGFLQFEGLVKEPVYLLDILAEQSGPITTLSNLQITATRALDDLPEPIDTLIIPGGYDMNTVIANTAITSWIRGMAPKVKRLASVCSGAFLLAECGLLDQRRATSHWDFTERLQKNYPAISVEPDRIFIRDENIYTSGGITSGIDLALAMVAEDWGQELALYVARYLVVFLQRPGGQSQFSAFLISEGSSRKDFRELKAWIIEHPGADLNVETLAERMAMSPRNFARVFVSETGMTPAKFVELSRLDAARHYLISSDLSVEIVAEKCGFGDSERMRRTFLRQLGVNPHNFRLRFSAQKIINT